MTWKSNRESRIDRKNAREGKKIDKSTIYDLSDFENSKCELEKEVEKKEQEIKTELELQGLKDTILKEKTKENLEKTNQYKLLEIYNKAERIQKKIDALQNSSYGDTSSITLWHTNLLKFQNRVLMRELDQKRKTLFFDEDDNLNIENWIKDKDVKITALQTFIDRYGDNQSISEIPIFIVPPTDKTEAKEMNRLIKKVKNEYYKLYKKNIQVNYNAWQTTIIRNDNNQVWEDTTNGVLYKKNNVSGGGNNDLGNGDNNVVNGGGVDNGELGVDDDCNPSNFNTMNDYLDKGIKSAYTNGYISIGGAKILMATKNIANIALGVAGLFKIGKGVLGMIGIGDGSGKDIYKGLLLGGSWFIMNNLNITGVVSSIWDAGKEERNSWSDNDKENIQGDYEDLSEQQKLQLKGAVGGLFSGIKFSQLLAMGVLTFDGDGNITGMDYNKMKKYINNSSDLTDEQKEDKLKALNNIILAENGDNGSKLSPIMEELGINKDTIIDPTNNDSDITDFVTNDINNNLSQDEALHQTKINEWKKQLNGIDIKTQNTIISYVDSMYKDGVYDVNFEVIGSDIYVKQGINGEKVKLDLTNKKIKINGKEFPGNDLIGLSNTKGLLYLAYYTSKALNISGTSQGYFEHKTLSLSGINQILFTNGSTDLNIDMKNMDKYVSTLNQFNDGDKQIKAYVDFLNETGGKAVPT